MFADDNEAEESATGATRYPVMPSLVALQQMRSRLHMAQLGRKLMKWTSVAAAAELRRISADLQAVYKTFAEDMREAFILLARCRYFFPDLNKMVVNDLQKGASVTVSSSVKTVSGVRIIQYRIVETDTPYDFLGLGAGGETIEEAKKAWVKLLKLQIRMVELRRSFLIVEEVHKTATKRLNVINKIVIPRTKASIKYIQLELEEIEREELHRIKKIQAFKKKRSEKEKGDSKGKVKESTCVICQLPTIIEDAPKTKKESRPEPAPPPPLQKTPTPQPRPPPSRPPTPPPSKIPTPPPPRAPTPAPKIAVPSLEKPSELIAVHEPIMDSRKEVFKPICCKDKPSKITRAVSPISHVSLGDYGGASKLEYLKEMLDTTISVGQDVAKSETGTSIIDEVLKLCKEAKLKLDIFGDVKPEPNTKLAKDLDHLKSHIREVIDITRGLRDVSFLSPSVENFVKSCEKVDEKLKVALTNVETTQLNADAKNHLLDLKDEINDVLKVITAYKEEGLLTQSAEDFARVCEETKSKIDGYTHEGGSDTKEHKLEHLKSHVDTLETLTTDVKRDGLRSASIERFLASCKDFKQKLEEHKNQPPGGEQVSKLITQIDAAVKSTQAAKEEGLTSPSIDKFIKSCENFKTSLESKGKESHKPVCKKMKTDIEEVMDLINNLRKQGLIDDSTANFLKMCENTKNRLDLDEMYSPCALSKSILSPECGERCTCQSDQAQELCDRCKEMYESDKSKSVTIDLPSKTDICDRCTEMFEPPCKPCPGMKEEEEIPCSECNAEYPSSLEESTCKICTPQVPAQTSESSCKLCKQQVSTPTSESECKVCTPRVPSSQTSAKPCGSCISIPPVKPVEAKGSCAICEAASKDSQKQDDGEEYGVFEKKIRTITKITRYKTETGDIREEKEVTTIKKVKHDPTETDLDDEDLESGSFDIAMCITPTQNQMGFRNMAKKSKSEQIMRVASLTHPYFRQCVSFNPQVCFFKTPSQNVLANDSEQVSSTTSLCLFQTSFI